MNTRKQKFLETVPLSELIQYKKCLNKGRGRPTKECSPIMKEYKNFVNNQKVERKLKIVSKDKPLSKDKSASKPTTVPKSKPSKPMTFAEKCKKTPIAKCNKNIKNNKNEICKVFKTPNGKYCRKSKLKTKQPSKQEKKALSMMA